MFEYPTRDPLKGDTAVWCTQRNDPVDQPACRPFVAPVQLAERLAQHQPSHAVRNDINAIEDLAVPVGGGSHELDEGHQTLAVPLQCPRCEVVVSIDPDRADRAVLQDAPCHLWVD